AGNEGLLVAEGEEDRHLDLRQPFVEVLGVVSLQFDDLPINVIDEDVGPLLKLLRIAPDQTNALLCVQPGISTIVHEVTAFTLRHGACDGISLLEIEEVTNTLFGPSSLCRQRAGRFPDLLPFFEVSGERRIK